MNNNIQKSGSSSRSISSAPGGLTSPQILARHAESPVADKIAIREKAYGIWQPYTWKEFHEYAKSVCLGLLSLGLKRGENIGLITDNRPEWLFSELGAQAAGAVTVNLFTSAMGTELVYDLNRLNVSFVFVGDSRQAEKILTHRESLPKIRRVIFIDPTGLTAYKDDPWLLSFNQLADLGKLFELENPDRFTIELWKGKPGDTAMMLMTSGATGIPKAAMISYENLMETAGKWMENVPLSADDNWVSLSPCAGLIEQTWCLGTALACGMVINFPETSKSVMNDMREVGPSIIVNYPGFWENIMSLIRVELEESGPVRKWVYNRSYETGRDIYDLKSKGEPVTFLLKFLHGLFRRIIRTRLMDRLGLLRVHHAYTGGNPISPEVVKFFRYNGLDLKQCYGLAETGGMFQFQKAGDLSVDTVGEPFHGTEIAIAGDSEILISGRVNFSGYYQDHEAYGAALKNSRLSTGDTGYLDHEGRLVIAGRKEDLINTGDGHVFSRYFIETRIKESPYIREAVIWGRGKPYLIAFIGIDLENTLRWAERHNVPSNDYEDLLTHPAIEALIKDEISDLNFKLPDYMRIRRIIIINKLLDGDEEFSKTGVARRKFLFEQYRDILDAMYAEKDTAALTGRLRDNNDDIRMIKTSIRIISVPEGGQ